MAALGFGLSSIGQSAADVAQGRQEGQRYRDQRQLALQEMQLRNLQYGLQVQEFQQRMKEANQPRFLGHVPIPGGGTRALYQRPDGSTFTQDIVAGRDPAQAQQGADAIIGTFPDDEGKKVAKALYQGLLNSTGDPEIAMKGLTTLQEKILGPGMIASGKFSERKQQGEAIGLKGSDLQAYEAGVTGATGYSFTPGGKRANRPPAGPRETASNRKLPDDELENLAAMAEKYGMDSISGIGSNFTEQVKNYMANRGMAVATKPNAAFEGQAKQAQAIVKAGDNMLQRYLNDPDVQAWLGPAKGRIANLILSINKPMFGMSQQTFDKLKGLLSAKDSYLILQPGLHRTRGAAMVEQFKKAVPDFSVPASTWIAQVNQLNDQARVFTELSGPRQQTGTEPVPDDDEEDVPPPEGATEDQ